MEDNKLIAEFLGKDHELNQCMGVPQYHKSWDWLMPVVEKIEEDERYDVKIFQNGTIITNQYGYDIVNNVCNISFDKKIEHTYPAVVEFINFHNQSKQK